MGGFYGWELAASLADKFRVKAFFPRMQKSSTMAQSAEFEVVRHVLIITFYSVHLRQMRKTPTSATVAGPREMIEEP